MTWQPMDTAPRDRRVLLQLGESHQPVLVVGEYLGGRWVLSGGGIVLEHPVAWQDLPEAHCMTCGGPCVFAGPEDWFEYDPDTRAGVATLTIPVRDRPIPCPFCLQVVPADSVHSCVRKVE